MTGSLDQETMEWLHGMYRCILVPRGFYPRNPLVVIDDFDTLNITLFTTFDSEILQ